MKTFAEFKLERDEKLSENQIRYDALDAMKQIQATISGVSLLNVLGVMKDTNPLRQNILDMEAQLHDLSTNMGQFIADNIADVESEAGEEADVAPEEAPEEAPAPKEEKPKEKPKKEEKPKEKDADKEEPKEEVPEEVPEEEAK